MTNRRLTTALTLTAATLLLAGCSDSTGSDGQGDGERMRQAAEAARTYQEAVLAQDWTRVCEAKTERLRGGTYAQCVERSKAAPARDQQTRTGAVTTGEAVEVDAAGEHPAGIGLLVSYDITHPGGSTETDHHAVRLTEGDDGQWSVDQAVALDADTGTSADVVRTALRER